MGHTDEAKRIEVEHIETIVISGGQSGDAWRTRWDLAAAVHRRTLRRAAGLALRRTGLVIPVGE